VEKPIEIKEADLIERPAQLTTKTPTSPASFLSEVQKGMKQVNEILELAKNMGLNLKLPGLGGGTDLNPETRQVNQAGLFLQLLQAKYGDLTINELLERLKVDFGNVKLSELKRLK